MILFQPCPYHFPDLWKAEQLAMPEITPAHLQAVKKIYRLPEDGDEGADMYFARPSVLAEAYARLQFQDAHGFLVEDNRLILIDGTVWVIESLCDLRFAQERDESIQLFEECFQRARTFALPEETPRRGFPSGMAHGDMRRTLCRPCAQDTWPPSK
ncbi:hypothetical protein CO174_02535 [Candidatus Uhrbacteria bacterium CG_4_9_14_3_um_filter_50_9]|uniref:Uncharacterized protein n=1 Tax=Candidatus Uhrbacteria bacterium CG_4_9_14_3_um_filter_50_9 TaxID=1975035 RepID=A0A2M7XCL9_9BACT|nr:MAG: hypothetical protein CO174_02535 [Candidatus Uhrbacteria bacterium CG_4_9_14_3_um_filter_50_9]